MSKPLLVLAAAVLAPITGSARADTIAFVRADTVYTTRLDGGAPVARMRSRVGFSHVAFDRQGRLYASETAGSQGQRCDLRRAGRPDPIVRFTHLAGRVGASGLCWITRDPRGGLLVEGSNETIGSTRVWHLDPASRKVSPVAYGYHPALSPSGRRLAVVQHRYYAGGGRYETLAIGTPGRPGSFTRIVPIPPKGFDLLYSFPAFAPDGRRIAAVLSSTTSSFKTALVVGRVGGSLRPVWRITDTRQLGKVAWLPDGRALLVSVFDPRRASPKGGSQLVRVPLDGGEPSVVLRDLADFALWQR